VGEETRVGSACSVTDGAVIGRGCRLTARVRIGEGQRVEPDQVLSGAPAAGELARRIPARRAGVAMPMQASGDLLARAGG